MLFKVIFGNMTSYVIAEDEEKALEEAKISYRAVNKEDPIHYTIEVDENVRELPLDEWNFE